MDQESIAESMAEPITENQTDIGTEETKKAKDYEAEILELKSKIQELTAMLQSQSQASPQPQLTPEQIEEYNRKFIENPVEMMAKVMEKYQKEAIERATRQAEQKLALERFWARFEQKYPNLYAEKWALDKVIEEDYNVIKSLGDSEDKIMDYIAKRAAEKIQGAYRSLSKAKPSATPEGYSPFTWPGPTSDTSSGEGSDSSLTSILKERKLKRMKSSGVL